MNTETSFKGIVVEGKQIARTRGFPTANLIIKEEIGKYYHGELWVVSWQPEGIFTKPVTGICNILENGKIAEIHFLNFKDDLYGKELEISIHFRLNKTGNMKNDIEQIKKCSECRYCVHRDYGYSAWTVEGATSECVKVKRENFDIDWWRTNTEDLFATICDGYEKGEPLKVEIEH